MVCGAVSYASKRGGVCVVVYLPGKNVARPLCSEATYSRLRVEFDCCIAVCNGSVICSGVCVGHSQECQCSGTCPPADQLPPDATCSVSPNCSNNYISLPAGVIAIIVIIVIVVVCAAASPCWVPALIGAYACCACFALGATALNSQRQASKDTRQFTEAGNIQWYAVAVGAPVAVPATDAESHRTALLAPPPHQTT